MGALDYTDMGEGGLSFPSTHWSWIEAVRGVDSQQRNTALEQLIGLYWKPAYCWLRRYGYDDATAKDLVQGFFLDGLEKKKFRRADKARGRFRTFLLTCLKNFVKNYERDKKAKGRQPSRPIISIDQSRTDEIGVEIFHTKTPEDSFNQAWVRELLLRVLRSLEEECNETGKQCHYELFCKRIIEPILNNVEKPPMTELAKKVGLTEKQANNYVITARRAYHRLLRSEIRNYASSDEEVASEIQDLFKFVAES